MNMEIVEHKNNKVIDWERLQIWLQEAAMLLDYCTRLVIAKRTAGDIDDAMGDYGCFKMQFETDDKVITEDLIQEYVANIGKLAEDGWETNQNFPILGDIPSLGAQGDRSC